MQYNEVTFRACSSRCSLHYRGRALNCGGRVLDGPRGLCPRRGCLLSFLVGLALPVVATGWRREVPRTLEGMLLEARAGTGLLADVSGRQSLAGSRTAVHEATCSCSLKGLAAVLSTKILQLWSACCLTLRLAEGPPGARTALAWLSERLRLWLICWWEESRICRLLQGLVRREGGQGHTLRERNR